MPNLVTLVVSRYILSNLWLYPYQVYSELVIVIVNKPDKHASLSCYCVSDEEKKSLFRQVLQHLRGREEVGDEGHQHQGQVRPGTR